MSSCFVPCGTGTARENLPLLRSLTTKPSSSFSVEILASPETTRRLFWRSIVTSSFFKPGSSKVAVMRLLSADSWTSILKSQSVHCSVSRKRTDPAYLGAKDLESERSTWPFPRRRDDLRSVGQSSVPTASSKRRFTSSNEKKGSWK